MDNATTTAPAYGRWRQAYHRELSQRAEAATLRKVRSGLAVGRLPLGYEYGQRRRVQVDSTRERLIREAFLLAAEGKYSLQQILSLITAKGLRARSGKALSVSQLWRILTNPFYSGTVTYRDQAASGRHQPLVSQDTFQQAREQLAKRRRS